MRSFAPLFLVAVVVVVGCIGDGRVVVGDDTRLGPVDGRDLPATDLERVRVGDLAPDFALASLDGPTVMLSDFRGEKNVILVFYRGYW